MKDRPSRQKIEEISRKDPMSNNNMLRKLLQNQRKEAEENVKIEYVETYEEPTPPKHTLDVVFEKVTEPIGDTGVPNLRSYNTSNDKNKLRADFIRKEIIAPERPIQSRTEINGLIEKFEGKMMQNISHVMIEITTELSKSFNRIQALSSDNAEYLEDCLRTNITEISRCLKISPHRSQITRSNEEIQFQVQPNNKYQELKELKDESEVADQIDINYQNEMFFDFDEKSENQDYFGNTHIKQENDFGDYEDVIMNNINNNIDIAPIMPPMLPPMLPDTDEISDNDTEKQEYKCKVCKKMFSNKSHLKRHQQRNEKCSLVIMELNADDLEKRQTRLNSKEEKILPLHKMNKKLFHAAKGLKKSNPDVPYKPCFFCHHAFQKITELIGHLQAAHSNENLDHLAEILPTLKMEDYTSALPELIKERLKNEKFVKRDGENEFQGSLNKCSYCPTDFGSFSRLISHIECVHPSCDKALAHWSMKVYYALVEKFPYKMVSCEYCGNEVKLETLDRHLSNHKQAPKECPTCKKQIKSKSWQRHLKSHEENEWLCNECGKSFTNQRRYKHHVPTHDPRYKGFECPTCHKVFNERPTLSKHISLVHEGLQKFLCQTCPYKASNASILTMHVRRVHTGDKPFKCTDCTYDTISKQELKRHVFAVHERENHFQCETCQWTSPRQHLMTMHIRLKCKMPPYSEAEKQEAKEVEAKEIAPPVLLTISGKTASEISAMSV